MSRHEVGIRDGSISYQNAAAPFNIILIPFATATVENSYSLLKTKRL